MATPGFLAKAGILNKESLYFDQFLLSFPFYAATVTRGHGFGAPWVVHVNGPTWSAGDPATCVDSLETCVMNCLAAADEKKFKSIAVPSIGSGK
jgi:O-acetyl-ADP-ribose deacetylase (regulator of RNase III)